MKTMTCKQMGGPCDVAFQAETADEMMKMGASHLEEMAASGDEGHVAAKKMMDDAVTNPEMAKSWNDKFQADFAALPVE
jgi:hypothetical protein